ncbi:MAG: hypothetical protein FJ319_10475 [SAR202 cluster bacterium]|nr:hypothetical protein [SAR202 cluster bacterium]
MQEERTEHEERDRTASPDTEGDQVVATARKETDERKAGDADARRQGAQGGDRGDSLVRIIERARFPSKRAGLIRLPFRVKSKG